MKFKEIITTALTKTKNVMKKLLDFLRKKRFSLITLFVSLILCLDLYSCIARPNAREPTTANASVTVVEPSPLLILNSYSSSRDYSSNTVAILPSSFIGYNENEQLCWYVLTDSPYKTYVSRVLSYSNGVYSLSKDLFLMYTSSADTSISMSTNWVSGKLQCAFNSGYITDNLLKINSYSYSVNVVDEYKSINYTLYDSNNIQIGVASFMVSGTYFNDTPNLNTTQKTIATFFASGEYQNGYDYGYSIGEDIGYKRGLDEAFENISPFEVIKSGVDSFLSMDIIGNINLGDILKISFGLILLGYVIKVFLGG